MHILKELGTTPYYGSPVGVYSVCSAHPLVIEAAVRQAVADDKPLLIEATSNQVNQSGGYTGMRPGDFRKFVCEIALRHGLEHDQLILGGDHLGPNPWQHLPAEEAMRHAEEMIAEYAREGFVKIHLDASMPCAGEIAPLSDEVVAERAVRLCRAAEAAKKSSAIFYVIGTEVPVPGGATESIEELRVTTYEDAAKTLETHRRIFADAGMQDAWSRVIAMVVQPGVEFDHESVVDYVSEKARDLRRVLAENKGLVFEAHSTDYQQPRAYKELVQGGFAILKVGPALTFALREALFALAEIEKELIPAGDRSHLPDVVETAMLAHPEHWNKHYHGTDEEQRLLRHYSYSDRLRYYWMRPEVESAVSTLFENLKGRKIPETILSDVMPKQYALFRAKRLKATAHDLVMDRIRQVLLPYSQAC